MQRIIKHVCRIVKMRIQIGEGYCYQQINNLVNVTTYQTSKSLMRLAEKKGAKVVSRNEAAKLGFAEIAEWSINKNDVLVYINDEIIVCVTSNDLID